MKNTFNGIISRLNTAEERTRKPENKSVKSSQSEINWLHVCNWTIQGEEERMEQKKQLKLWWLRTFQK